MNFPARTIMLIYAFLRLLAKEIRTTYLQQRRVFSRATRINSNEANGNANFGPICTSTFDRCAAIQYSTLVCNESIYENDVINSNQEKLYDLQNEI